MAKTSTNGQGYPGFFTKKLYREQGVGNKATEEYMPYSEFALFSYNEALGRISQQNLQLKFGLLSSLFICTI